MASTPKLILAATALAALSLAAPVAEAAPLTVTLDKAEVINLEGTANVVLIANPQIADVVLEQGHLLFVLGKQPGETRLFVYDTGGKQMLDRDVIVVPTNDHAVTVTRDAVPTDYTCAPHCVASGGAGAGTGGKPR